MLRGGFDVKHLPRPLSGMEMRLSMAMRLRITLAVSTRGFPLGARRLKVEHICRAMPAEEGLGSCRIMSRIRLIC